MYVVCTTQDGTRSVRSVQTFRTLSSAFHARTNPQKKTPFREDVAIRWDGAQGPAGLPQEYYVVMNINVNLG